MPKDRVEVDVVTNTQGSIQSLTKYTVAIGAAVVAVKKLYNIGKDLVNAYSIQEKAETKLSSAVKTTGHNADISVNALKNYAAQLQKVTVYGDEATISAMAMLQQLGNLGQKGLMELTPLVQDFATAMGLDLESAASLVGKTIGSSTNALTRYGIEVDMSGTKSDKLASVVEGLAEKFGGLSEEVGKNSTSAFQQLGNAIGDFKENSGKALADFYEPAIRGFTNLITKINETITQKSALDAAVSGHGTDYGNAIIQQEKNVAAAQKEALRWTEMVNTAEKQGYENLAAYTMKRDQLYNQLVYEKNILFWLQDLYAEQNAGGEDAVDDMQNLRDAYEKTSEYAAEMLQKQIAYFSAFKQGPMAVAVLKMLREQLAALNKELPSIPSAPSPYIYGQEDKEPIIPYVGSKEQPLPYDFTTGASSYDVMLESLKNIDEEFARIESGEVKALDALKAYTEYAQQQLADQAFPALAAAGQAVFETLGNAAGGGAVEMKDVFKNAFLALISGFEQILWAQAATFAISGAYGNAIAAGPTAASLSFAKGVINAMGTGGTVTKPTLALIGEAGPEEVRPLSRSSGSGMTVHQHFHGTVISDREGARAIWRLINQDARGF